MACGQRKVVISKCQELLGMMDYALHNLMLYHQPNDLKPLLHFRHSTFNATDTPDFIHFFRIPPQKVALSTSIIRFFSLNDYPERTRKHMATPDRQACL